MDACRRQGIDPEELLYVSFEAYKQRSGKKGMAKELLQTRWEHYETKRKEKINLIKQERRQIIDNEKKGLWKPTKSVMHQSPKGSVTKSKDEGAVVVTDSAMLDKERKQLEKIKLRQQQELQQMVDYELKTEEIRLRNEEKLKSQREKEEQQKKELMAKTKKQEELRQQKEAMRQKKLEEEIERERERQRIGMEKQKQREEEEKEKAKKKHEEARKRDEEQKAKQEEFKKQTEKIAQEQMEVVEQRKKEIEEKDKKRKEQLEKKQEMMKQEGEKKRLKSTKKIEATKQKMETLLEEQREVPLILHNSAIIQKKSWQKRKGRNLKRIDNVN